jgi:hypothetical protein
LRRIVPAAHDFILIGKLRVNTRECESKSGRRIKIGHAAALVSLASLASLALTASLISQAATTLKLSKFTTLLVRKRLGFRVCQILAINTCHLESCLIAKSNIR